MPFGFHDPRFDTIVQFLRTQSGAVTLGQVRTQFQPALPERSALRLLTTLVQIGVIAVVGKARQRRYLLRVKPGPLGQFIWFRPDSAAGAMILGELPAPKPRKPKPPAGRRAAPTTPTPPSQAASVEPSPSAKPTADKAAGKRQSAVSHQQPPRADAIRGTPPARVAQNADPIAAGPAHRAAAQPSAPSAISTPPSNRTPASTDVRRRASAIPTRHAQLFASSVSRIISGANDRTAAELNLQTDAAIDGLTPPEMEAYMPAALAALDTLTADEAARYGVTSAAYARWRQRYPSTAP